jgi:hypothetical protein
LGSIGGRSKIETCEYKRIKRKVALYGILDRGLYRGVATCVYQPLPSPTLMLVRNNAASWDSVIDMSFRASHST